MNNRNGMLLYFVCGMAVTVVCAVTASLFIMPYESRISVHASPEPVSAAIPVFADTPLDMERNWIPAAGITTYRDNARYVEGCGSTCFIIDNIFSTGPVATGPVMQPDNTDTGEPSFWIRVLVEHGDASCIRLETEHETIIPFSSELQDISWYRVSWRPEYDQTVPVTLKVDSDEFQGTIWLDGFGPKPADDVGLSFDDMVSPPPGASLNSC
jgi:hypothetical protein